MKLYAQKTLIRHGLRRATFPQGKALGCAAKQQFTAAVTLPSGGAPRSESEIQMIAGGNHTYIFQAVKNL